MLKRIVVFVVLKLVELIGVVGVYLLLLCEIKLLFIREKPLTFIDYTLGALACISVDITALFALFGLCWAIYKVVKINWRWAGRISKGERK